MVVDNIELMKCKNCKYYQNGCKHRTQPGDPIQFKPEPESTCIDWEQKENIEKVDIEVENAKHILSYAYHELIRINKDYVVMDENQYKIIALWLLGTYAHEEFETFPLLFFNAMRGSGKTRELRLISALGHGGDGSVQNNLTEAVLFRIPRGRVTCIDEMEQIGNKEKSTLRELLNAAYKKGMKVCRMKKTKKKNDEGQLEEMQIAEEFEPFFPIALANINGLDEVLSDRAITLILEKSDDPEKTKKIEDFTKSARISWLKTLLMGIGVRVYDVLLKKHQEKWNFWLRNRYNIHIDTPHTHIHTHTLHTLMEQCPGNKLIQDYQKSMEEYDKTQIEPELEQFFIMLDEAGISGRNFELFSPLLILAKSIDDSIFNEVFQVIKDMVKEKKSVEYSDSRDVSLYEFVKSKEDELNGDFISIKQIVHEFRNFANESDNEDKWLNETWMGKALMRLNLVVDKRRMKYGKEVRLNFQKAKEKLKIFF